MSGTGQGVAEKFTFKLDQFQGHQSLHSSQHNNSGDSNSLKSQKEGCIEIQNLAIHAHPNNTIFEEDSTSRNKSSGHFNDASSSVTPEENIRPHKHIHNAEILRQSQMRISQQFLENPKIQEDRCLTPTSNHNHIDFKGSFQLSPAQKIVTQQSIKKEEIIQETKRISTFEQRQFSEEDILQINEVPISELSVNLPQKVEKQLPLSKKNSPSSSVFDSAQSDSKVYSQKEQSQILSSNCEPINEIKRTSQSKIIKKVDQEKIPVIDPPSRHLITIQTEQSPYFNLPSHPIQSNTIFHNQLTLSPPGLSLLGGQKNIFRQSISSNRGNFVPAQRTNVARNSKISGLQFQNRGKPRNPSIQDNFAPRPSRVSSINNQINNNPSRKSISSSNENYSSSGQKPIVHFTYKSRQQRNHLSPSPPPRITQIVLPTSRQRIEIKKEQVVNWCECYQQLEKKYEKIHKGFNIMIGQFSILRSLLLTSEQNQQSTAIKKSYNTFIQQIEQIHKDVRKTYEQSVTITHKQLSDENKQFQAQLDTIKKLTSLVESYQSRNQELYQKNSQLDKRIGQYCIDYAKLDQQYHQLDNILTQSEAKLNQELQQLRIQLTAAQNTIAEIKTTNSAMKQELEQYQKKREQSSESNNEWHQTIRSFELKIKNLELHNSELIDKNSSLLVSNGKLEQLVASQKQQINGLQHKINIGYEKSVGSKSAESKSAESKGPGSNIVGPKSICSLEGAPSNQEIEKKQDIKEFQSEESSMKEQHKELQMKEFHKQFQIKESQIDQLKNEIDTLKKQNQKLTSTINNLNLNLQVIKQSNTNLQNQNKILLDKNNNLRLEVSDLKSESISVERKVQSRYEEKLLYLETQLQKKSNSQNTPIPHKILQRDKSEEYIEEYEKQIDRLKGEIRIKQQEKRKLEDDIFNVEENARRKVMEKQSEIRLLNDKVTITQEEMARKLREKQRKIKGLEEQIEALKRVPNRKSLTSNDSGTRSAPHQLKHLKQQFNNLQDQYKELLHQKQEKDKKIGNNNQVIISLEEELSKCKQEILGLKRQVSGMSSLENEIRILTESLNKKSAELLELKTISFQHNQLEIEVQSLKKERVNLREVMKARVKQIQYLNSQLNEIQIEKSSNRDLLNRSVNRLILSNKGIDDSEDLPVMNESMRKKNGEISKLKQTNRFKASSIEQMEKEIEMLKKKIENMQRSSNEEKSSNERKIKQLEQSVKKLDLEKKIMHENYELEIETLEIDRKNKEETVKKLEGETKVLKTKLKGHDSKVQEFQNQIQGLHDKIAELQAEKSELKKQISGLEDSGKLDKNKLYDEYQVRISDLETAATIKDKRIKQLEQNIENLKLRISAMDDPAKNEENIMNQQQIEGLKKQIAECESRIYKQNNSKTPCISFRGHDFVNGHVFEQKIVYELKSENQRLKTLLKQQNIKIDNKSQSNQHPTAYIQNRLLEFNERLEAMIRTNRQTEQYYNNSQSPPHSNLKQGKNKLYRGRAELLRRHEQQIEQMQKWMIQLHRYCASLETLNSNTSQNQITAITINNKQFVSKQIMYYKSKNKELEDLIDNHLNLNRQLKEKLEGYLKVCSDPNQILFYKQQIENYERKIYDQEATIRKINEKSTNLQRQLDRINNDQSVDLKLMDFQNIINELKRKISSQQTQIQILKTDNQKMHLDLHQKSNQIFELEARNDEKSRKIAYAQKNLKRCQQDSEDKDKVKKTANSILILEAEIDRLNQLLQKQKTNAQSQITKLHAKISLLQSRVVELQGQIQESQQKAQKLQKNENQLSASQRLISNEIQRLNNIINMQTTKCKDYEREIDELERINQKNQKEVVQKHKENSEIQAKYEELYYKYSEMSKSYRAKCSEYTQVFDLLEGLRSDREQEGDQSKKKLQYIAEMEANIDRLKHQVSYYKSSHNSSQNEIEKLQVDIHRMQQQINRLRTVILEIQEQTVGYSKLKNTLKYHLEYMRSTFIAIESLLEQFNYEPHSIQSQTLNTIRNYIHNNLGYCCEAVSICDQ